MLETTATFSSGYRTVRKALVLFFLIGTIAIVALSVLAQTASAGVQSKHSAPNVAGVPACGPGWVVVPSPNVTTDNTLYGVAAISSSDVWAVGDYEDNTAVYETLVEQWDGSVWSVVPSPNPGTAGGNHLSGVAAVSSDDVWAVGYYEVGAGPSQALVEHWDGSVWSVVPSPSPGTQDNWLRGVAAVSSNNVWAVGTYDNGTWPSYTLAEHWDGSAWSVVPSANPGGTTNDLFGVSAVSSTDVWAVGNYLSNEPVQTLVEHWDGSVWSVVQSPNAGTGSNNLYGVAAISGNDVWAVGDYYDNTTNSEYPLAEHWDGNAWSAPGVSIYAGELHGVSAESSNDIWAVGYYYDDTLGYPTLVERYNPCGPPTATSTATSTPTGHTSATPPGTPASTRTQPPTQTPGGPTATPEPTQCPIEFTDVPPNSTFYQYIRCLACRGIVEGYTTSPPCTTGTPCFLPANSVTRGQMAKFVSNAAGYSDTIPPNRQTFTDVPPNSTFWLYIERAYLHGVIGGYTMPSSCPSGTPCFLPGNNVTRGQTAKFVSIAANYQDVIPPNRQSFTDVAPNSTFWMYVERVYLHQVVNGYTTSPPCTTGTPCFLTGHSVTRGQTSKFISNAFSPNCQTPLRR